MTGPSLDSSAGISPAFSAHRPFWPVPGFTDTPPTAGGALGSQTVFSDTAIDSASALLHAAQLWGDPAARDLFDLASRGRIPKPSYPDGPPHCREVDDSTILRPLKPGKSRKKRGLVLCGGGDSPGMNAAIFGFVIGLNMAEWESWGVLHGWSGLTDPKGLFTPLTRELVGKFYRKGGAMLGTGHRKRSPFNDIPGVAYPCANAIKHLRQFDALFVIGGNGSGWVAEKLLDLGIRVYFTVGTIDRDIPPLESIGFASAAKEGTDVVEKISTSGSSCGNVMIVEIMGANRGALPLQVGIASGADYVMIPEVGTDLARDLYPRIRKTIRRGRNFTIVVAEGADFTYGEGRRFTKGLEKVAPSERQIGRRLRDILIDEFGLPVKDVPPRYLLRGAPPLPTDVALGLRAGLDAARYMTAGRPGLVIPPSFAPQQPYKLRGFFTKRSIDEAFTRYLVEHWKIFYGNP